MSYSTNILKIRIMKTIICSFILAILCITNTIGQHLVTGTIKDANNSDKLPGVNIVVAGTTTGTISNIEGKFSITIPDSNAILNISYIGYLTEEIEINNKTSIDIALIPDLTELDEIVVLGYGTMNKSDLTGSVTSVRPYHNRRVAGVNVKNKKKVPGGQVSVNIRGVCSMPYNIINESYSGTKENGFKSVSSAPLSTFSIDVDRASYSNVRRFLNLGQLPPINAIRVEEMINYFEYNYSTPKKEHPLAIYREVSNCPWNNEHLLMHVGMQAQKTELDNLPASNLVFLIDVSGSMSSANKLPLLKRSLHLLVNNLRDIDRVAIVVYAGAAGLVLQSTKGTNKEKILDAIDNLSSGGSTAGGAGIKLAYKVAEKNFIKNGNNRVILATDGDFNIGISSNNGLEDLIEDKRGSGIFLTCLGYGMGNYKDSKLEILADKGNGNYAYIDNIQEAEKMLVEEFAGTMFTIAKDVKIQIEFNPAFVQAYRLVGYENRLLNDEDFKDDNKDAGEIGSGHSVTALYEIIPKGVKNKFTKNIDALKYQKVDITDSEDLATIKVRYKPLKDESSVQFDVPVSSQPNIIDETSNNFRFSASVAMFGMQLRNSAYLAKSNYDDIIELAKNSKGEDEDGYKAEFIRLVKSANTF
jgi:Ca-activated chloride channel family protein